MVKKKVEYRIQHIFKAEYYIETVYMTAAGERGGKSMRGYQRGEKI